MFNAALEKFSVRSSYRQGRIQHKLLGGNFCESEHRYQPHPPVGWGATLAKILCTASNNKTQITITIKTEGWFILLCALIAKLFFNKLKIKNWFKRIFSLKILKEKFHPFHPPGSAPGVIPIKDGQFEEWLGSAPSKVVQGYLASQQKRAPVN